MLRCLPIDVRLLTAEQLQCGPCQICAARSKLDYPFDRDLKNSDELVAALEAFIDANTPFKCERTTINKNPDVVVVKHNGRKIMVCRVEAKITHCLCGCYIIPYQTAHSPTRLRFPGVSHGFRTMGTKTACVLVPGATVSVAPGARPQNRSAAFVCEAHF